MVTNVVPAGEEFTSVSVPKSAVPRYDPTTRQRRLSSPVLTLLGEFPSTAV
jgi:hypothetical protein